MGYTDDGQEFFDIQNGRVIYVHILLAGLLERRRSRNRHNSYPILCVPHDVCVYVCGSI